MSKKIELIKEWMVELKDYGYQVSYDEEEGLVFHVYDCSSDDPDDNRVVEIEKWYPFISEL